ncbi:hypothetical protein [Rheinheimera gaetbuli]
MKSLTLLTATTLMLSALYSVDSKADEFSAELHAATAQQLTELQPEMVQQAYRSMLQTVIDVKARLQAQQDASTLLASQGTTVQVAE